MPLYIHLSIHFLLAILVALIFWQATERKSNFLYLSLFAAILGGFLIDIDHAIEYIIIFHRFSIQGFLIGWQFLWSGKNYLIFHAWEYLPILLLLSFLLKKKVKIAVFLAVFAAAGSVHLLTDCFINNLPPKFYSISYRAYHDFSGSELLSAESQKRDNKLYQKWYLEMKAESER